MRGSEVLASVAVGAAVLACVVTVLVRVVRWRAWRRLVGRAEQHGYVTTAGSSLVRYELRKAVDGFEVSYTEDQKAYVGRNGPTVLSGVRVLHPGALPQAGAPCGWFDRDLRWRGESTEQPRAWSPDDPVGPLARLRAELGDAPLFKLDVGRERLTLHVGRALSDETLAQVIDWLIELARLQSVERRPP